MYNITHTIVVYAREDIAAIFSKEMANVVTDKKMSLHYYLFIMFSRK